jgi:hypothetical protein
MKNTNVFLGLVALALLASPAKTHSFNVKNVGRIPLVGKFYADENRQALTFLVSGMLAKAATTYLGSHNNSGKDIAKNVALSAAGNLGAVTALALANKVYDKGHSTVAELGFSVAVAIYVCAQNSWNPFPVIKKLVLSPKETLRKFVSHRFSAEDIAKFVVNTGTLVACYKHTTKPAVPTGYHASSMQLQDSQRYFDQGQAAQAGGNPQGTYPAAPTASGQGYGMGHGVDVEQFRFPQDFRPTTYTPRASASGCQQNPTCIYGHNHSGPCSQ